MRKSDGTFEQDIQCIVEPQAGVGAIFISNIEAASNPQTLKKNGIGAVITALQGKNLSDTIPRHIEYLYIPAVDHQSFDISQYFEDSYNLINEERKRTNVLVHCMAGVSRSVSLVIAYLMRKNSLPFDSAFAFVKRKRPIIHPNSSFIQQLKQLENKCLKKTAFREQQMNKSTIVKVKKTKAPQLMCGYNDYQEKLKLRIKELFSKVKKDTKQNNSSLGQTGFSCVKVSDQAK